MAGVTGFHFLGDPVWPLVGIGWGCATKRNDVMGGNPQCATRRTDTMEGNSRRLYQGGGEPLGRSGQ
jgi:hypothetical protein